MLRARIWTFLKIRRFSSKIAIFKRVEKGRGLAMAGSKLRGTNDEIQLEMRRSDVSLNTKPLKKTMGKNNDPKAVKNFKFVVFICDRDFVVVLKQIKKIGIGSCGISLNLEKFNN
jgi:hypothetical protein